MNFPEHLHVFYYNLCVSEKLNDTIITLYYYVYTALLTELSVGVPIIDDPRDVLNRRCRARVFPMT